MNPSTALEDLRDENLVAEVAYSVGGTPVQPLLFHPHASTAFYLTVEALRNLEEQSSIGPGPFAIPAVVFWFLSTEGLISLLYKCAEVIDARQEMLGKRHPFGERLVPASKVVEKARSVHRYFAGGVEPAPPLARLNEFAGFRNDLAHDLTAEAPRRQYAHTAFAPRAEKANQSDAIEAGRVALQIFAYFRGLFRDADLMPSINLDPGFEKLDILFDEVLLPAYCEILAAKSMTSRVKTMPSVEACPAQCLVPLHLYICMVGPTTESAWKGGDHRVDRFLVRAKASRRPATDKFSLPRYTRENPAFG